jgi:hypothetical protein
VNSSSDTSVKSQSFGSNLVIPSSLTTHVIILNLVDLKCNTPMLHNEETLRYMLYPLKEHYSLLGQKGMRGNREGVHDEVDRAADSSVKPIQMSVVDSTLSIDTPTNYNIRTPPKGREA